MISLKERKISNIYFCTDCKTYFTASARSIVCVDGRFYVKCVSCGSLHIKEYDLHD